MNEHKLIERLKRLKKIERLRLQHMLRKDDDTTAFYCFDTDEIRLFIDVVLGDCKTHYDAWGMSLTRNVPEFVVKFLSRTVLHELFHWSGEENDRQCEYWAISLTWDETTAKIVSGWIYPGQKIVEITEVEIEDVA